MRGVRLSSGNARFCAKLCLAPARVGIVPVGEEQVAELLNGLGLGVSANRGGVNDAAEGAGDAEELGGAVHACMVANLQWKSIPFLKYFSSAPRRPITYRQKYLRKGIDFDSKLATISAWTPPTPIRPTTSPASATCRSTPTRTRSAPSARSGSGSSKPRWRPKRCAPRPWRRGTGTPITIGSPQRAGARCEPQINLQTSTGHP